MLVAPNLVQIQLVLPCVERCACCPRLSRWRFRRNRITVTSLGDTCAVIATDVAARALVGGKEVALADTLELQRQFPHDVQGRVHKQVRADWLSCPVFEQ
jgi:hypothetical protein